MSYEPWVRVAQFEAKLADKTVFYCGAAVMKGMKYLSYIEFGSTNPEELEDQAKELEDWAGDEMRSSAEFWADLYRKHGLHFCFSKGN